jgi:hypothetical protein
VLLPLLQRLRRPATAVTPALFATAGMKAAVAIAVHAMVQLQPPRRTPAGRYVGRGADTVTPKPLGRRPIGGHVCQPWVFAHGTGAAACAPAAAAWSAGGRSIHGRRTAGWPTWETEGQLKSSSMRTDIYIYVDVLACALQSFRLRSLDSYFALLLDSIFALCNGLMFACLIVYCFAYLSYQNLRHSPASNQCNDCLSYCFQT